MSKKSAIYIDHILDEIGYLTEALEGVSAEKFHGDETLKRAVVRSLTR